MKACVSLCACSTPDNSSSLPSACRYSKDSWVRFRSRSGSEVGRWCRRPLVHRTTIEQLPNKSESRWVVWRAWHTSLPHTLSFCLLSSSVCLSVRPFQPPRALTRANSKPRKPHLADISPLDMNNTATLKILFSICGIFDGEVTLVSVLQIQICPLFPFFLPILWKCSNCEVKSGPSLVCLFVFLLYVSDCKSNPDAVASAEGLHVTHAHGSTYAHTHSQVNVAHKCR